MSPRATETLSHLAAIQALVIESMALLPEIDFGPGETTRGTNGSFNGGLFPEAGTTG
jgi:hypothetical protein